MNGIRTAGVGVALALVAAPGMVPCLFVGMAIVASSGPSVKLPVSDDGGLEPIVAAGRPRLVFGMAIVMSSGPSVTFPVLNSEAGGGVAGLGGGPPRFRLGTAMVMSSGPSVTFPVAISGGMYFEDSSSEGGGEGLAGSGFTGGEGKILPQCLRDRRCGQVW